MTDITISGGGLSGLLAAQVMRNINLEAVIFERAQITELQEHDGRLLAIAYKNKQLLERHGMWNQNEAQPILGIRVMDGYSRSQVYFEHDLLGSHPFGYMIPARSLYASIDLTKLDIHENTHATVTDNNGAYVSVHADKEYTSQLHILAEGKKADIPVNYSKFDYNQTMITFMINHEYNHQGIVTERFFECGPFAVLPREGGRSSSIVWAESKARITDLLLGSRENLMKELRRRVDFLGDIEIEGEIYSFDLGLRYAHNYSRGRVLVFGDAAHAIHPLSGQGFNLTVADMAALETLLTEAVELGLDISSVLKRYEKKRKAPNSTMIAATDCLNGLFSNNSKMLKIFRRTSLDIINKSHTLRKMCMLVGSI